MSVQPNVTIDNDQTKQNDVSENEDVVNPWEVKAESMTGVDYDKIIGQSHTFSLQYPHLIRSLLYFILVRFGSSHLTDDLVQRMQTIIQRPVHHFIRRRIFFSHRFVSLLSAYRCLIVYL